VLRSFASRGLLQTATVSFNLERLPVDDRVTRSSPSTCPTAAPRRLLAETVQFTWHAEVTSSGTEGFLASAKLDV